MGLFDVFTFKKDGKKVFSREVFKEVLENARENIIEQAKKNITGQEKKQRVDEVVAHFIHAKIATLEVKNGLVLWLIDRVISLVPLITQLVYDFLKQKVENL